MKELSIFYVGLIYCDTNLESVHSIRYVCITTVTVIFCATSGPRDMTSDGLTVKCKRSYMEVNLSRTGVSMAGPKPPSHEPYPIKLHHV